MIIDKWEKNRSYVSLHPFMAEAIQFADGLQELPAGRYEFQHGIFALVQRGKTTNITLSPMECHRHYLDIQIMVQGREIIEWQEITDTRKQIPYNQEKDVEFRSGTGKKLMVSEGEFYMMFPHDCHKCCGNQEDSQFSYYKIVLKLPI